MQPSDGPEELPKTRRAAEDQKSWQRTSPDSKGRSAPHGRTEEEDIQGEEQEPALGQLAPGPASAELVPPVQPGEGTPRGLPALRMVQGS